MELEKLIVPLILDDSVFKKNIEDSISKSNNLTKGLSAVGGGIVVGGIAAVGAGLGVLTANLIAGGKGISEYENEVAELNAVLTSTGNIAGVNQDALLDQADAIEKTTKFTAESAISAQSMLLTFTNIGNDVFPAATTATMNLAEKFGSVDQASVMLGKALNDPLQGISALRRVGIQLTAEQEKSIESFMELGDIASAQKVILGELDTQFGDLAVTAGNTLTGKIERLKNGFGNMQETLAGGLVVALGGVADKLLLMLDNEEVLTFVENLGTKIGEFATTVITGIPQAIQTFQNIFNWLSEHNEVIIGILAAIGVAVATFVYTTVIPALVSMYTAFAPVIAVMLLVGVVAGLLYLAWENNFLGIRDTLQNVWASLQPVFETIRTWLQTNIPIAIEALKNFWENVLLPAIMKVWSWIQTNLIPLFQALGELLSVTLGVAITALAGFWENILQPALKTIWEWMNNKLFPVIEKVANWLSDKLKPAFEGISGAIQGVIGWVKDVTEALRNIKLPAWLTPGSPTPFEIGLYGISDAMKQASLHVLPKYTQQLELAGMRDPMNGSTPNGNSELVGLLTDIKEKKDIDTDALALAIRDALLQVI